MLTEIKTLAKASNFLDFEIHIGEDGQNPLLFDRWPLPLSTEQVAQLSYQGNRAQNWNRVKISPGCNLERIRNVIFEGNCLIGDLDGEPLELFSGLTIPPGIENCRLRDVLIGDGCAIFDVALLSRVDILRRTAIQSCQVIAGGDLNPLGLDRKITFSPSIGERQLSIFPGMTSEALAWLAVRIQDREVQEAYQTLCDTYRKRHQRVTTLIASDVRIVGTRKILRSAIGPGARIESAACIEDSILLSTPQNRTFVGSRAIVQRCTTGCGVELADGCFCENSHFDDLSWAHGNARVTSSIFSPYSGVTSGECSTSFVGPFTSFTRQALLISTFWPEGRGNVSYGANIGTSHSGRAADQEHWAGEGIFYGLGASIRFPSNFVESPWLLIASGVTTLPQRVEMPFSLIQHPTIRPVDLSPAFNELVPGWSIEKNLYGLLANEEHYRKVQSAYPLPNNRTPLETRIFRPTIIPLLLDTLDRLHRAGSASSVDTLPNGEMYYLESQIPGIGKNFVRESARQQGICSLEFAINYILALTIFQHWNANSSAFDRNQMVSCPELDALAPDVRARIPNDFTHDVAWDAALKKAFSIAEYAVALARTERKSDIARGIRIIPDYTDVHGGIESDRFLQKLQADLEEFRQLAYP